MILDNIERLARESYPFMPKEMSDDDITTGLFLWLHSYQPPIGTEPILIIEKDYDAVFNLLVGYLMGGFA